MIEAKISAARVPAGYTGFELGYVHGGTLLENGRWVGVEFKACNTEDAADAAVEAGHMLVTRYIEHGTLVGFLAASV